jgi:hypothetical protein
MLIRQTRRQHYQSRRHRLSPSVITGVDICLDGGILVGLIELHYSTD